MVMQVSVFQNGKWNYFIDYKNIFEDFLNFWFSLQEGLIMGSEWSKLRKNYFPPNVGVNPKKSEQELFFFSAREKEKEKKEQELCCKM